MRGLGNEARRANDARTILAVSFAVAAVVLGLPPSAAARLHLVVTQYGYLTGTPKVSRVNPRTGHVRTIASGSPLTSASYLTFEPNGKIAVTDENLPGIFVVNPRTGRIRQLAGAGLEGPYGIDTNPRGNLIVAEYGSNDPATRRVIRVNRKTGALHTIKAGGWLGSPLNVAVNPHTGTIFVVDDGGAIDRLSPSGHRSTLASEPPFSSLSAIARARHGTLFVTDSSKDKLFRVNPQTGAVRAVASGLGADPYGVTAAPRGKVYTTDYAGGTVNRVNPRTGNVRPIASGLDRPIGITVEPKR